MAKGWKCPRCGVMNDGAALNCSSCRLIRGAVVPPGAAYASPAPGIGPAVGPPAGTLESIIERGLRAYLADPERLEFVTFSVIGTENIYVQFASMNGVLVGEAVSEEFLAPEQSRLVDGRALERLGFALEPGSNYGQSWSLPPDVGHVAAVAAAALRTYGIPDDAGLHVVHATGPARSDIERAAAGAGAVGAVDEAALAGPGSPDAIPFWRRIPLQLVVIGVIVLAGAIAGWYFNAGRSSTGEITKSGDLFVADLRVGDCFDLKDPTAEEVGDVTARVCSEEHEFELFFVGALTEDAYPSDAVFADFVDEQCTPAFDAYVGRAYLESELDVFYFVPSADGWDDGDRSVQCALYHPLEDRLTGSLRGSGR